MKYILNQDGSFAGTCETNNVPPLPFGQQAVDPTPALDAAYAAYVASLPAPGPCPPAPYTLTKWTINERLIARDLDAAFRAALASVPRLESRWIAAATFDSDSSLLAAARDQLLPALDCTVEEVAAILRPGTDIP